MAQMLRRALELTLGPSQDDLETHSLLSGGVKEGSHDHQCDTHTDREHSRQIPSLNS